MYRSKESRTARAGGGLIYYSTSLRNVKEAEEKELEGERFEFFTEKR